MRSYEAARGSFSLFELLARLVIAVGILAAVAIGFLASESMGRNVPPPLAAALGALPGGLIALAGFFGLAMAQMGRATVDSAEYAQQALSVSRQQLELSQQMLEQGKTAAASYAELLKRQPVAKVSSPETAMNSDTGSSYATRPAQAKPATQLGEDTEPMTVGGGTLNTPAQLESAPEITVENMLSQTGQKSPAPEITKVGSSYMVGNKAFKTRGEAKDYRRTVPECVFHGYVAIESMNMWPRIPRACGHRFHGMWPPL